MNMAGDKGYEPSLAVTDDFVVVVDAAARLAEPQPVAGEAVEAGQDVTDFPCSAAQERFWLLDRLEQNHSAFNVAVRWRLEGQVSHALLERAWLRIIERHEVLRTVFFEIDGIPRQRILAQSRFKLGEIDLRHLPDDQRQIEGDRIGTAEAGAPFDLAAGPLLRAMLLRVAPAVSIILVTTHQIVSDGWSIGVMAREMGEIYAALRRERAERLDELPLQYADYSMWQLEWLRARGTAAEVAYWSKQLDGVRPFKVPSDLPPSAIPTTNGAIASIVLPRELTDRAQALSGRHGATLFATALSALSAVLSRYTGESEVVLGTQVSDRDQVELEGMVGQFVNSLILRNNLDGDPRFGELIERSRDTIAAALEHRHIPIEQLLGLVKTPREGRNVALISVNFIFQRTFIQNADYGDFKLVDMPSLPAGAIYDLNFFMVERPDGWRFSCQYHTGQFEAETAARLLNYVERALASAVQNPQERVSQLALIDAAERRLLFADGHGSRSDYPHGVGIAGLFETQARLTPQAIAVVAGDRSLAYRQLDIEANRLARFLIARGVVPGRRVGVCVERSEHLPIALLAILKVGGAYVPLDGDDPPARLAQVIDAARVSIAIVSGSTQGKLPASQMMLVNLDTDGMAISRAGDALPGIPLAPDSEACTLFVASRGAMPNGLRISQRGLIARLWALRERPGIAQQDVLVAVTPLSVDAAAFELLMPLLTGARLVVASAADAADSQRLLQLLRHSQATVMHALPAVWSSLVQAGWIGRPRLRALCTIEGRDRRLASQLLDRCSELWALFACPEATLWSAAHRISPQDDLVPIGEPLANARLYVLDATQQLSPLGAPGELYIGGDGVALGFLDALAARHTFPPDPFSDEPKARLVRTGDRVRMRHNGDIEYLGRTDQRIAINGLRMEPSEIETVLQRHPDVATAAVTIKRISPGKYEIAAFVSVWTAQPKGNDDLVTELRYIVEAALPAASCPTHFVVLKTLPKLADGSIDRRALRLPVPEPKPERPAAATALPGDSEQKLLKLWRKLLERNDFDIDANFFELGGHSLRAARMLGHIEADFGKRISLAALFRAPNIRELAKLLDRSDMSDFDFRQVVKLQASGSKPAIIGINNTGIYYMLAKRLGLEQPFVSLQLFDPSLRTDQLPKTLEEIAAGYADLIRRVQPNGPYTLMGWCVAGSLAFEIARQLDAQDAGIARVYLMDSWAPDYFQRLSKLHAFIANQSLRWQFIRADWRRIQSRRKSVMAFFTNRKIVRKAMLALGLKPGDAGTRPALMEASPEAHDQWLLGYLKTLVAAYKPRPYRGRLTLFRSTQEPTGWWFDPNAGWARYAEGGIDLHIVEGDHFTMFQGVGVRQLAERINAITDRGDA